ncbi:MAG TPA: O-antigen ligase family protein [Pyrinomonadaceae bacterium]|nr:O-antigen ligase family protein [Pyrinomonadaceae bacterium]
MLNPSTPNKGESAQSTDTGPAAQTGVRLCEQIALAGFALYAAFAPHSIAGAEIALALVGLGWLARLALLRRTGIRRSALDLPISLFLGWTVLSSIFSAEPRISLPKLQAIAVVLLFYLTQSIVTRRAALLLAVLMIVSGVAGVAESIVDLARGRGVMIEELSEDSPFHELQMGAGDAVWRVNARRVHSIEEIDEAIRRSPAGQQLPVGIIKKGEHGDRPGFVVTDEMKARQSPSGIKSSGPTHRFRASGWTRHYETFSETLQILAQLAVGLALAALQAGRKARRRYVYLALGAAALLVLGIALTAMRTTLIAFGIGASLIVLRATRGRTRLLAASLIALMLFLGALSIWHTRPAGALTLEDHSAALRWQVARTGLSRIILHPVFGHGMDAVKSHWTEWGFPGTDMIHLHSTPLQIAFDRGLPALMFWLWMMGASWWTAARGEKAFRELADAGSHGLLLGATGAIAGFFSSSLVNYNFGDAEVALVFWWLMGTVVVLSANRE